MYIAPMFKGGPNCAGYLHPSLRYLHGILAVGMTEVGQLAQVIGTFFSMKSVYNLYTTV